ncbi:MAG TPA: ATP-dependent helicase [Burkholderiales bacterium]|nr:ATP-dependent helicase [Burkholderiales bacterium]
MAGVFDLLNPQQRQAACAGNAPLLIVAGAGTGKTNTLAHRVAFLILNKTPPERILLLTFTRRAALEMTRRANRIVADVMKEVKLPWSGTFHAIANKLIRKHARRIGLSDNFSVLDRGDAADLMDVARHERGFSKSEKRFPRKDTCLAIYSHAVNSRAPLAEVLQLHFPWCAEWEAQLKQLFASYVEAKLRTHSLDYDDLLLYWHAMMADEALAAEIGALFDHILVDEYQDTNVLQAEILKNLSPSGEGVTVVGDEAQAIYSFRAASVDNIRGFATQYPNQGRVQILELQENYRSTQPILDTANALIGKNLFSRKSTGSKPRYVSVADDQAQAHYVVREVLAARERGVLLRRQAVLFRASHHSDLLELELVRRNIPYVKYGGLKFLEAAHVKDLLAILRWADNPQNRVAAFRALQLVPGIGPAGAERVFTAFESQSFAWSALRSVPELDDLMRFLAAAPWEGQVQKVREWYEPHLERRYDAAQVRAADLLQLEKIAANFSSRESFLTEMALDPPQATSDLAGPPLLDEDYLVLSTVHSAKGQEWEAVHILNVADGNFPSEFSTGRAELVEEERRLLYVAMTRAKTDLHVIAPLKYYVTQQSRMGDRHVYGAKSRFMTAEVLKCMEPVAFGEPPENEARAESAKPTVDVATRLRGMWA